MRAHSFRVCVEGGERGGGAVPLPCGRRGRWRDEGGTRDLVLAGDEVIWRNIGGFGGKWAEEAQQ